jgi:hypothetical protein
MSFTLTNLMSDARFLVFGDSSNSQYGDTDLKRNINRWYNTGLSWILQANGDWQVEGEKATTDLVSGQSDYALPSDIIKLNEVYVKYDSDYIKAVQRDPINNDQDPDSNYNASTPEFDLMDNSIYLYLPSTIPDMTAGLKIHYQTDITELANSNDVPNIAEPFKRLLSVGSAYDYCVANEMWNKTKKLEDLIYQSIKQDLLEYYANRSTARPIRLIPKESNYR